MCWLGKHTNTASYVLAQRGKFLLFGGAGAGEGQGAPRGGNFGFFLSTRIRVVKFGVLNAGCALGVKVP